MGFYSDERTHTLEVTERVASIVSLVCCAFVFLTFLLSQNFRKPANRLIFYAICGNTLCNVGTLMSQAGIRSGSNSAPCQFQAFLIQLCLPADAAWNLAMAINVYLSVFKKYNAAQLRRLEWRYLVACYGIPFVPAFVFCFVSTEDRGKIYGNAVLWCWVSQQWDFLRIALCYGPAWACILTTLSIYVFAGHDIFQKRKQLRSLSVASSAEFALENPFVSYKTTEIQVTSELANIGGAAPDDSSQRLLGLTPRSRVTSNQGYEQYSITIERGATQMLPTPRAQSFHTAKNSVALEANAAAWGYTKCALLFFVSLLITWVPSSLFRVYSLVHPYNLSWPLGYAAGLVLPLMGFWNSVIYLTISWAAVKALFSSTFSIPSSYRAAVRSQSFGSQVSRAPIGRLGFLSNGDARWDRAKKASWGSSGKV